MTKYKINIILLTCISFFLNVFIGYGMQPTNFSKIEETSDENNVILKKWFNAWELVSNKIYKINKKQQPVEFIFFDETYVYSTSKITIKNGSNFNGPSFFNNKLNWKKEIHNGKILLPNKQEIPIGIICFAGTLNKIGTKSFFVMPLFDFWQKKGVESKEISLENLTTGIFLHEFSHTQQMRNFGKRITEIEVTHKFDFNFSDDIIQDYFKKDINYISDFESEVKLLYEAAFEFNNIKSIEKITTSLENYNFRQESYFKNKYQHFKEIDDLFLTMEGFGQFTIYVWLIDSDGGNIDKKLAIKAVRRDGKNWSQEHGFGLFLILEKLSKSKNWIEKVVSKKVFSVKNLILSKLQL